METPNNKQMYKFTLKNKTELIGEFVKFYPYKNGIIYLILIDEKGKKYQINPKNAKLI